MSNQNLRTPPTPQQGANDDLVMIILMFAGGFVVLWLAMLIVSLSPFYYLPLTFIPYAVEAHIGFGSGIVFLMYAIIVYFFYFLRKKKEKEKGISMERSVGPLVLSVWLVLMGMYHIVFDMVDTSLNKGMFAHIEYFCAPANHSALWFLSCQRDLFQFAGTTAAWINGLMMSFAPAVTVSIAFVVEIWGGFLRMDKHPDNYITRTEKRPLDVDYYLETLAKSNDHMKVWLRLDPSRYRYSPYLKFLQSTREFAFSHGLIKRFVERPTPFISCKDTTGDASKGEKSLLDQRDTSDAEDLVPEVDAELFHELMLDQLGPIWSGPDKLSPLELFFVGHLVRLACSATDAMDEPEAKKIKKELEKEQKEMWLWVDAQVSTTLINKKHQNYIQNREWFDKTFPDGYDLRTLPDFSTMPYNEEFLKRIEIWQEHPVMMDILHRHGYVKTVIQALFLKGRELGVLQPSTYRWVALWDSDFWAFIQNIGRPSVFAQSMAATSHYYAELKRGHKLNKPEFQSAYDAFTERLQGFLYPIEKVRTFEMTNKYELNVEIDVEDFESKQLRLKG